VIDALETYYRAGGKMWHQRKEPANAATDWLLDLVGIKNVVWKCDKTASLTLKGTESVTDDHPMFLKLFRRLVTHYRENGTFEKFNENLERHPEITVIVLL
jgi:hypothetical protein